MRVKRLDVLGFKSFSTKTSVQFEPGVTAIVGPNGSGKTNLVDAIRWVLGEHNPRDVRAPRLEDVIFNGTDAKAPLSMAEVSLTIDNEKSLLPIAFTDVMITRRVYRSGESECLINQSPCRLKDIQELFLGTGLGGGTYAIIEQGHIDMVLSAKPEERRVVFEEASGVAKYLAKKQEAQRRLDDVEQHLIRIADIIAEVRRQVSALERQAAKARQYKAQWEQLKTMELRLAADELREGDSVQEDLTQAVESLRQQRAQLDQERQRHLTALETWNATLAKIQESLQGLRTRLVESASRIEQHASELALKSRWIEELALQRQQLARDATELEGRAQHLSQQLQQVTAQRETLDGQHKDLLAQRTTASKELQELDQRLAEGLKTLEEGKGSLFEAAAQASQQRNALAGVTLRLQTVEAQLARIQEQRGALQTRLDALSHKQQQVESDRNGLKDQEEALRVQAASARQAMSQAEAQRHEWLGRLNSVREQALNQRAKAQLLEEVWRRYEGFPDAVKALVETPPEGVRGLLVDLLDPQPGYERAIEAALGPLAGAIVVQDRQALRRCQEWLDRHQLDGVQVVVLSDCQEQPLRPPAQPAPEGFLGTLSQFVRCDPACQRLVEWCLGSWGLVDDIDRIARAPSMPRGAWVSKAGARWDGQSWWLKGRTSGAADRVGRKQRWEQAREALQALEREVAAAQDAWQHSEAQWQSQAAHEERLAKQLEQLAPSVAKLEGQLALARHEVKRLQDEMAAHELDRQELEDQRCQLLEAQGKATQAASEAEARHRAVEDRLKAAQARQEEAASARQQRLVCLAQLDTTITACLERIATLQARLKEMEAEHRPCAGQLEGKRAQAQGIADRIADLTTQCEAHRAQSASLSEEKTRAQQEADRVAGTLREQERLRDQIMPALLAVEQRLLTMTQNLQEQESRLAERSFRRARILERLREIYHVGESAVAEQPRHAPLSSEERQALTGQIDRLKAKLDSMGPVSLGSVEEYDELTKRLEFLQAQQQDLLKSKEDLRSSIHQINRTARAQFRETFATIRQEFQHYFGRLFGGGQADLLLLDEEDVLESGVEIIARPPGKRPQSISLLSGGERALTAIALLFALFKVRPSPFCILDEIDAPLDEANIDRFTKVLEEFLSLSQFILITHNKKTITKADCLYGVTMEQPGISQIVSVKLTKSTRAPKTLPAEADAVPA